MNYSLITYNVSCTLLTNNIQLHIFKLGKEDFIKTSDTPLSYVMVLIWY